MISCTRSGGGQSDAENQQGGYWPAGGGRGAQELVEELQTPRCIKRPQRFTVDLWLVGLLENKTARFSERGTERQRGL